MKSGDQRVPSGVDPEVPSPARIYDYMLGGTEHFAADRRVGDLLAADNPDIRDGVRSNRRFLIRAVRFCAEQGVRQYLDIGAGLPTADNVHQVVARHGPGSTVVYADNDPAVLTHGRALLAAEPPAEGRTVIVDADLRQGAAILDRPEVRDVLDLRRPVALLLVAVLHFVADDDRPHALVAALMDALPPGSHLVLSHGTADLHPAEAAAAGRAYQNASEGFHPRPRAEVARFFDGLDLVAPGLVWTTGWRPDEPGSEFPGIYAGVARKPG